MRILRARLLAAAQEEADAEASEARRSQVRTVDRSERIRTYNFAGEPDLRPPHRLQGLQPRPGARRRPRAGARLLRRRRPRRPARRPSSRDPAPGAPRRGAPSAPRPTALRRAGRRVGPARSTTPTSCWPTCSASTRAGCSLVDDVPPDRAAAYDALVARRAPTGAAAAPAPASPTSATSSSRSGPACSCPDPRPSCWPAGRSSGRASWTEPGGRRPVHRLGRDRQGGRRRGARRPRARGRAGRPAPTPGPRATWPAPASSCGRATWPTAFDDLAGTVDVVTCNPPYIPLDAWESVAPEARDHDPHLRSVLRRRRARRDPGRSSARAAGCCGRAGWSAPSTPTCRASPLRPSSRPPAVGATSATTRTWPAVRAT